MFIVVVWYILRCDVCPSLFVFDHILTFVMIADYPTDDGDCARSEHDS
jgi:hypothetical protein